VDYPDCIAATWLGERLGVEPTLIDAMRRDGELIAVRKPGTVEWLYPAWQFDEWAPRPAVRRVVAAARDARIDESRLYELLTRPLGLSRFERRRLADLLADGREDDVVAAIRLAA